MPRPLLNRRRLPPILAGLASLVVFLPGIGWGLPSRAADQFLFGDRPPWTGAEIIRLAGGFEADSGKGADVDANPLGRAAGPVVLNDTDAKRAEIVRRYRLQSHQPDEFINFAAIAGMAKRRDLDPRLYQYGGLWLYPVAGLLGLARVVGYVHLTGDLAFYLDHPEAFGRFYVVARLYSAVWGAVAAGVVFVLVRRLTRSDFAGFCGATAFALLPVVVTAAHEAKPHLAGAALVLWATVKAGDFVRSGRRLDAVWAGVLCGAGASMVVSMVVGFALLPVMGWLGRRRVGAMSNSEIPTGRTGEPASAGGSGSAPTRPLKRARREHPALFSTVFSVACGIFLYALLNPFVIYHALFDRGVFASNLGNSTAMYGGGDPAGAAFNAARIFALGTGFWFAGLAALAVLLCVLKYGLFRTLRPTSPATYLLLAVSAATLAYFVPLADGKVPEYARFSLPVAAAAVVGLYALAARLPRDRNEWRLVVLLPVFASAASGLPYVANFVADGGPGDTHRRAADQLEGLAESRDTVAVRYEPAPWSSPPFDLWHWRATLGGSEGDVRMGVADDTQHWDFGTVSGRFVTPVAWAQRPFVIFVVPLGSE